MKQIAKILKKAFETTNPAQAAEMLGLSDEQYKKLLAGEMEITPELAVKIGKITDIEPRELMAIQTEIQLVAAGAGKPKEKAKKTVSTDGRPSQSPMHGAQKSTRSISC